MLENYTDIHSPMLPFVFVSKHEQDAGGIPQETKPNFKLGLLLCSRSYLWKLIRVQPWCKCVYAEVSILFVSRYLYNEKLGFGCREIQNLVTNWSIVLLEEHCGYHNTVAILLLNTNIVQIRLCTLWASNHANFLYPSGMNDEAQLQGFSWKILTGR